MQKAYASLTIGLLLITLLSGCTTKDEINSFEECEAAGNPVMESYPRQCSANGQTYTEELEMCLTMSIEQAIITAQASDCATQGTLTENYVCNENTETLWIDLTVEDKEGCNPACVVNVNTGEVETNWRCTGLILPE